MSVAGLARSHGSRHIRRTSKISRQTMTTITFSHVKPSTPDPMQILKQRTDADTGLKKIDLGAGVYRDEEGQYHEFRTVQKAKQRLHRSIPNHDYNPTTGIAPFYTAARDLIFGHDNILVKKNQIASVQTVAGTGANRIGAAFLRRNLRVSKEYLPSVYVGAPTWGNYKPLFENAGFNVHSFVHSKRGDPLPDEDEIAQVMESVPEGSIFVFQGCCHNPTGLDYSHSQWKILGEIMLRRHHFAFFDTAYQGFGSSSLAGLEDDVWGIRYLASIGIDMLVCQSFSKSMGLYSERVGALHVVCKDSSIAANLFDQLRAQIRWEVSSAPAYGARLAEIILNNDALQQEWRQELRDATIRLETRRSELHRLLTKKYQTPGNWNHILAEKGLFSYPKLSEEQVEKLITKHHVYVLPFGRLNIAGLTQNNVDRAAAAIDDVVRV